MFCSDLPVNRPRSIYQYSSMAPRLSGKNCKFFKFLLSSNSQKRLRYKENNTKYRSLTRKPRRHVRILIYRTWPIDVYLAGLSQLLLLFLIQYVKVCKSGPIIVTPPWSKTVEHSNFINPAIYSFSSKQSFNILNTVCQLQHSLPRNSTRTSTELMSSISAPTIPTSFGFRDVTMVGVGGGG